MSVACRDIEPVLGCASDGATFTPVLIHFEYRAAASGATVVHAIRYTNADGTVYTPPPGFIVTPGACVVPRVEVKVTGGGASLLVAGAVRAAAAAFSGAPPSWDTSTVAGRLHSITVSARSVTDGWRDGATANQIVVDCPDGTTLVMLNNQTFTWSVIRDTDVELTREYRVRATGSAYANIGYTFV